MMTRLFSMWRFVAFCAVVFGCLGLATGCGGGKNRRLTADPTFSINVLPLPGDWPNDKKDWPKDERKAAFQQAVYDEYGRPDYFRVLYDRTGRVITQRELREKMWLERDKRKKRTETEFEWIYLEKGLAFRFEPKGPVKRDLPDNLRTLCDYGDPMEIKTTVDINKRNMVIYQYYDRGKIFYFHEGKLEKEEDSTPMPGMTMRK